MYLNFYGLNKEPFLITPDPSFLYLSPSHREALASLVYGIEKRMGILMITGDVGTGKTTIIRSYLEKIDRIKFKTVYIFNPHMTFFSLLKTVFEELDLNAENMDECELVRKFHKYLIEEYKKDNIVVIIIDEAQNVPIETLEKVRMLSNLETHRDKLVQIILIGQNNLDQIIQLDELKQLKQRIAIRVNIKALNSREIRKYILHRLCLAGRTKKLFSDYAIRKIEKHSKGIPRLINVISNNTLLAGYSYKQKLIRASVVRNVLYDMGNSGWRFPLARAALIMLGAATLILMVSGVPSEGIESRIRSRNPNLYRQWFDLWKTRLPKSPCIEGRVNQKKIVEWIGNPVSDDIDRLINNKCYYIEKCDIDFNWYEKKIVLHLIQPGDNLYSVAKNIYKDVNERTIEAIKKENPEIGDIDLIKAGEIIRLPRNQ